MASRADMTLILSNFFPYQISDFHFKFITLKESSTAKKKDLNEFYPK